MGDGEYPKAIYRDGGAALVWGEPIETSAVDTREELMGALADGWRLHPLIRDVHPLDHDGDGEKGGSLPRRRGRPPKNRNE